MQCIPYLQLNGNAREAIGFYEKVFHAENLGVITYGEMLTTPDFPFPEDAKDLVSHATIRVGESVIMFSDTFPGQPAQEGNLVTICVTFDNADKARQIFEALQDGGQVEMPLSETGFSPAYGVIKDKFGVTFQIYTEGYQG
ncbi:VOC family protein [Cytobacillus solani]|uniref:3-demethylubiquinone-9 3-methyltransferase n=1 Tax=Cytobacillus solani TaxID=1637975 RepID=A0A0Q3QKU0_9BACI|nr:VOC family protein [Cytobacillus solani]KOP81271.1 3-demethylubiquinone-9 3-methyltransferase [Bacillus sp. FJAT-21945]KQL18286.1 3-demethylubiquinone-9 3-methyltransferase [Cytobacillus solani]USK56128.1 VOC family protein [Cytobacillus solani]